MTARSSFLSFFFFFFVFVRTPADHNSHLPQQYQQYYAFRRMARRMKTKSAMHSSVCCLFRCGCSLVYRLHRMQTNRISVQTSQNNKMHFHIYSSCSLWSILFDTKCIQRVNIIHIYFWTFRCDMLTVCCVPFFSFFFSFHAYNGRNYFEWDFMRQSKIRLVLSSVGNKVAKNQ